MGFRQRRGLAQRRESCAVESEADPPATVCPASISRSLNWTVRIGSLLYGLVIFAVMNTA